MTEHPHTTKETRDDSFARTRRRIIKEEEARAAERKAAARDRLYLKAAGLPPDEPEVSMAEAVDAMRVALRPTSSAALRAHAAAEEEDTATEEVEDLDQLSVEDMRKYLADRNH